MAETEAAIEADARAARRVLRQCIALGFAGVPLYAWAWFLGEPRLAEIVAAAGFFVSYALPLARWLYFLVSRSESFG